MLDRLRNVQAQVNVHWKSVSTINFNNIAIRCKNFKCASSPSQCERPFSTYSSVQIDRTFDPYEENTVTFAYDMNQFSIAKLKIPSSAFKVKDTDKLQAQI